MNASEVGRDDDHIVNHRLVYRDRSERTRFVLFDLPHARARTIHFACIDVSETGIPGDHLEYSWRAPDELLILENKEWIPVDSFRFVWRRYHKTVTRLNCASWISGQFNQGVPCTLGQ